jgi:hypothetical protein
VIAVGTGAGTEAAAAPPWSAPVTVSRPANFLGSPFIGFGVGGRALVAWHFQDGIGDDSSEGWRAATRRRDGTFTSERGVPDMSAPPVVYGRLDAAGELGTQVLAGLVQAGGSYPGEETVSNGDRANQPWAAFDPVTGAPTIVWSQRIGRDDPGVPIEQLQTVLRTATRG